MPTKVAHMNTPHSRSAVKGYGGGVMAGIIGFGTALYVLLILACAGYLLVHAYNLPPDDTESAFYKLAIAALVTIFGTGLTAMAAVYGANRQSETAYQVELLRSDTSERLANQNEVVLTKLAEMKDASDTNLLELKNNSDDALARLKVGLDAGTVAYRELFGTATIYFYTLRSIAFAKWEEEPLKAAEGLMIAATRHLIHVEENMRNEWFDFWQRAQKIYRVASSEADETKRPECIKNLIEQKLAFGQLSLNLRDLLDRLEKTARSATKTATTA
jgi:hypothetical protein